MKIMPVSDVRRELNRLLGELTEPVYITQRGRVRGVLVDFDDYQRLIEAARAKGVPIPGTLEGSSEREAESQSCRRASG